MAIITAYDRMGFGLNMADTESSFVPNSNDLIPDGDPNVSQYDYDTYLISQWFNGYQVNFGIYASQYSGNIWTLESLYVFNSEIKPVLDAYKINIRFNVTDDFSAGTYFTNLLSGNDIISGNKYTDIIKSGAGNDFIYGYAGNDTLLGEAGKDTLDGGSGTDTADYSDKTTAVKVTLNKSTNATVYVNGVAEDTIKNIENINGGSGADTITGDAYANTLNGNSGNDTLKGGLGKDILDGGSGTDTADYSDKTTAVKVTLNKSTNATVYVNNSAEDTIKNIENINGGSGADTITGDAYANTLIGNSGNDTLNGGAGSDTLIGGTGTDKLYGGSDTVRDVFDFNSITESKVGTARDKVYNFVKGIDDLDLKTIDANTKVSGDQAFKFAGTKAGANSLWYAAKDVDGSTSTKDMVIYGDVNGDGKADFEIGLVGVTSIAATDFVL